MGSKEINCINIIFQNIIRYIAMIFPVKYPQKFKYHIGIRAILFGVFVGSCRDLVIGLKRNLQNPGQD
jgi:hypothetical protein